LKRKVLAAREDLVDQILEIAKQKNLTVFGITNDALKQVIRAEEMGLTLRDVVDHYEAIKTAREAGFILAIESLWYDVVNRAYQREGDRMLKKWYEAGQWYGKYYMVKNQHPIKAFKKDVYMSIWDVSELSVTDVGDNVLVRCISPRFPLSYTRLFSSFLEGVFNVFGYKCVERDISKGVIRLSFKKSSGE